MMNTSPLRLIPNAFTPALTLLAVIALAPGCRSSRQVTNPDDGFFVPLTSINRPAAPAPSKVSAMHQRVDTLLMDQKEQDRRIGVLTAQLQRVASSRKGEQVDSSLAAKKPPQSPARSDSQLVSPRHMEVLQLYKSGQYRSAAEGFRELLQRGVPAEVEEEVHYMTGVCYFKMRQFDLASSSLKRVVNWKGSKLKGDAYYILGQTYKQLGARRQAKTMFNEVLKASPRADLAAAARRELKNLASKK